MLLLNIIHSKYFAVSDWLILHNEPALTKFGTYASNIYIPSIR